MKPKSIYDMSLPELEAEAKWTRERLREIKRLIKRVGTGSLHGHMTSKYGPTGKEGEK